MTEHYQWSEQDYRSLHWQHTRQEAKARSEGLCQLCGLAEGTIGHHLRYDPPAEQNPGFVTWLCVLCNEIADQVRKWSVDRYGNRLLAFADMMESFGKAVPELVEVLRRHYPPGARSESIRTNDHQPREKGQLTAGESSGFATSDHQERPKGQLTA